jgi:hypothetical protein
VDVSEVEYVDIVRGAEISSPYTDGYHLDYGQECNEQQA